MLSNRQGGVIINISSTPTISGHFKGASYTMAKARVMTLTKHIARKYCNNNIRAYTLMLDNIPTEATIAI